MSKQNVAKLATELARREVKRILAEEREKTFDTLMRAVISASTIVLHDEFGFGVRRLNKFTDRMVEQFDCINFDTVTLQELEELANELQGVKKDE